MADRSSASLRLRVCPYLEEGVCKRDGDNWEALVDGVNSEVNDACDILPFWVEGTGVSSEQLLSKCRLMSLSNTLFEHTGLVQHTVN